MKNKFKLSFVIIIIVHFSVLSQANLEILNPSNCEIGCGVSFTSNPIEAGLSDITTVTIRNNNSGGGANLACSLSLVSASGSLSCSACVKFSIESPINLNIPAGANEIVTIRFNPSFEDPIGPKTIKLRVTAMNDEPNNPPFYPDVFDDGTGITQPLDVDISILGETQKTVIKSSLVLDRVGSVPAQYGQFTSETLPILLDTAHEAAQDVTHFYIHEVFGGELYLSDGTTLVSAGDFISQMEGKDGVKFLPTTTGSTYITVRAAYSNSLDAIAGAKVKFLYAVAKTPLVVTAGDLTRTFEEENQQPIISYSGFVFNEDSTVLDRLPNAYIVADQCSDPGSYPIVVSGGYDDHYDLQVVNGILTIDEAEIDEEDNVVLDKENIQGRNATSIKIYPNPSNSTMRLDFIGFEKRKYVTILTNDGAIFKKFSIDQDSYTLDFGTSGLYMIKVEDSKGMIVEKVIVHK